MEGLFRPSTHDSNARRAIYEPGSSIGFYKFDITNNNYYRKAAREINRDSSTHIINHLLCMYLLGKSSYLPLIGTKEISLSDYLFKYKKTLDPIIMDLLIQTGVIESKNIKIVHGFAYTELEDITKINEERIKEISDEIAALSKNEIIMRRLYIRLI